MGEARFQELTFVRHGESEANITRTFSNQGDRHPLTPKGLAQAHELAARLAGIPFAQVFTSPVLRAVQTAEILARACGVPAVVAEALREWDVGLYEGTDDPEGWAWHARVQEDWFERGLLESRMPGGESFFEIRDRFVPFIEGLTQAPARPGEAVLLVAHGGLYHAMLPHIFTNVDYAMVARHPFANTAYAVAEARPEGLRCREWCGVALPE